VLRTAAEHLVAENDNVHYFPSYESIILSDRHRAYKYDMVHVEQELVDLNVGRMVSAYAGRNEGVDQLADDELLAHIREVSQGNSRLKWNLLTEHEARIPQSGKFAVEYIQTALSRKDFKNARSAFARAPGPWEGAQKQLMEAAILIGEKNFAEAKALLQSLNFSRTEKLGGQGRLCFFHLMEANIGLKDMDAARDDAFVFSRDVVKGGGRNRVYEMLAKGFKDSGRLDESAHYYARAIEVGPTDMVMVDYAEVLVSLNQWDKAKAVLDKTMGDNAWARRRKEHLMSFVASAAAKSEAST
jgi:tetratricopeptide (TPR) repeat protein